MTTTLRAETDSAADLRGWFAMIPPSIITPEQYADLLRPFTRSPEIDLLVAIMADAVTVWMGNSKRPMGATRLREIEETQRWFDSDEVSWPFSFVNVCSVLDLDPAAVRRALAATREATADGTSLNPWRTLRRGGGRRGSMRTMAPKAMPTRSPPAQRIVRNSDESPRFMVPSSPQRTEHAAGEI